MNKVFNLQKAERSCYDDVLKLGVTGSKGGS